MPNAFARAWRRTRQALATAAALLLAGVLAPANAQQLDARLVGSWQLQSSRAALAGELRIEANGNYRIGTQSGQLARSTPAAGQASAPSFHTLTVGETRVLLALVGEPPRLQLLSERGDILATGSRTASNPLGVEWAGSGSSQPSTQPPAPTGGGLGVEWVGGNTSQPPKQPTPPAGGGLDVEWRTGGATTQPTQPTQPTSPPASSGGLDVEWRTGSNTRPTPPQPTTSQPTQPTPPAPATGSTAACPPQPVPVMPANNPVSIYPDYISGHHHGFQDAWRRSAEQRTPPQFDVTRVSEHYRRGYYDGLRDGDLAWKRWRAANPPVPCTTGGQSPAGGQPPSAAGGTNPPSDPVKPSGPGEPSSAIPAARATVWAWGENNRGQLMATPTGGRRATPLPVLDRPVRAIAAGGAFTLFIDADGALWAAGRNEYGELGDPALPTGRGNTKALRDAPAPVPGMRDVLAVAAGGAHILALRKDGTVWAWGFNGSFDPVAARAGQLGTDAVDFTATPRQVPGLTDVVAVAAGSAHSVALRRDGTVWVWGNNAFGQLGDGTRPRQVGDATSWRARPTQVSGLTDVIAIAAGWHHTLALKRDGTVWSWGHHGKGQLGGGAYPGAVCVSSSYLYEPLYCPRPVQVMGVYGQTPALGGVRAISAGGSSSMALLANGTVVAWGDNAEGQLGTAFREKYPDAPLADPKWRSKSAAGVHAPLPVDQWDPATQRVAPLTGVVAISMGTQHTLALKGDGTVWSWGSNGTGQLGVELQGTFKIDKKYPYAFLVPELTSAHLIAAGGLHSVVGIRR